LRGRSAGMAQAFSEESVISGRNLCNKLWNIARLIDSWVEDLEQETTTPYTTDSMGEDWICREIDTLRKTVEKDIKSYRFSEAVEEVYSTIWDKYADWFLESQKLFKNLPLLKKTLEELLIIAHPFMPFVTEAIWQSLSWTDGLLINQTWPEKLKFDPISAEQYERLKLSIQEIRRVLSALKGQKHALKKTPGLLYGDDSLIADNAELIKFLTKTPKISPIDGEPRGIRLAVEGREVYLDVEKEITKSYKETLEERILSVGRELDALNARMMNPNYVDKAPAHLVEETRQGIKSKEALIDRLRRELEVIR
ncbi:class I tRNA ligase family protein, partial [Candidatus Saccharibacteria bacterium]|nr:class I tRNA ligase family protein [Candidatus Saccharibacteria bacterium]